MNLLRIITAARVIELIDASRLLANVISLIPRPAGDPGVINPKNQAII